MWPAIGAIGGALVGAAGNLISTGMQNKQADQSWRANYKMQKEFAQHGIRWKVKDAIKAGIHPLAAMGANTMSPTPINVGYATPDFGQFGQDISRAITAQATAEEKKLAALKLEQEQAKLEGMKLANQGARAELQKLTTGPSMPAVNELGIIQGQGIQEWDLPPDVAVTYKKSDVPISDQLGVQGGIPPLERYHVNADGTAYLIPSETAQEALEASWYHQAKYGVGKTVKHAKHAFYYNFPNSAAAKHARAELRRQMPKRNPGKGYEWRYSISRGGFVRRKKRGRSLLYDSSTLNFGNKAD